MILSEPIQANSLWRCGTRWARFAGLGLVLAAMVGTRARAQEPGSKRWEFAAGSLVQSSPAIGLDGTIYVGSDGGKLYALTPTGVKEWEFTAGGNIISSPAIGRDGAIYFGSVDRQLYAVNPDGTERWRVSPGSGIVSSPVIAPDGTIYVGSAFNKFHAVNPDGSKKWDFETGGNLISSPALGADGTVYFGSWDNHFYALAPDGSKKWSFATAERISSSPAIGADHTLYFGSLDGSVYALSPGGTKKWSFATGAAVRSSPVIGAEGTIYIGSDDRKLYALNPDGTKKWEFTTGHWVRSSAAVSADGTIYIGSYDQKLYALDALGAKKWEFATGAFISSCPAIGPDGAIYFGSWDRMVYAVKGHGGLAASPWPMFRRNALHAAAAGGSAGEFAPPVQPLASPPIKSSPVKMTERPPGSKPDAAPGSSSADRTKPTVTIISPYELARFTEPEITLRGTASDDVGLARVEYQLGASAAQTASGTTNWSAQLVLKPGNNKVWVMSVDVAGNTSYVVNRNFNYYPGALVVRTAGNGRVTPNLAGKKPELGKTYTLTATPDEHSIFTGWTGSTNSNVAKLAVRLVTNMVLQANFSPKPPPTAQGNYHGLVFQTNSLDRSGSGFFTFALGGDSLFKGRLLWGGVSHPLAGQFDAEGRASQLITRSGRAPLRLEFNLDLMSGADQVSGTLTDDSQRAELLGDRLARPDEAKQSRCAGKYTLILSERNESLTGVSGDGYGAVAVDGTGMLRLSGALPDGTPINQELQLSPGGMWAVYVPLYGGKGSLSGWVAFHPQEASDLAGQLQWSKPGATRAGLSSGGFNRTMSLLGVRYVPAPADAGTVTASRAAVAFSGGTLPELVANVVTFDAHRKITVVFDGGNKLKINLVLATGLFSGSFVHPVTHATTAFEGAWLQRLNLGSGFFTEAGRSGHVFFGGETNGASPPIPRSQKR